MKHPRQPGLFDVEERAAQLTEMGDPLVVVSRCARVLFINWHKLKMVTPISMKGLYGVVSTGLEIIYFL